MLRERSRSGRVDRRAALFVAAAGALILAVSAFFLRGPLIERWRTYRPCRLLERGTLAEKVRAAEELGRTGSPLAVVPLLRFIAEQPSHLDVQRIEMYRRVGSAEGPLIMHDVDAVSTKDYRPRGGRRVGPVLEEADLVALVQSASIPLSGSVAPVVAYGNGGPPIDSGFRVAIQVTAAEDLQQRASLAVKALLHWYDPATEYAEARQAVARIGKQSIPVLKKAVRGADHPGVRALAALELVRLGVATTAKEALFIR